MYTLCLKTHRNKLNHASLYAAGRLTVTYFVTYFEISVVAVRDV